MRMRKFLSLFFLILFHKPFDILWNKSLLFRETFLWYLRFTILLPFRSTLTFYNFTCEIYLLFVLHLLQQLRDTLRK